MHNPLSSMPGAKHESFDVVDAEISDDMLARPLLSAARVSFFHAKASVAASCLFCALQAMRTFPRDRRFAG